MLRLQPCTLKILKRVEELSGRSVQFMRDEKLQVLSTLQIARNGAEFHVLRYQPSDKPLDYLVAYQAAFALRMFENPADQRFDFNKTEFATIGVTNLITAGQALNASDMEGVSQFAELVTHWALMNLRSLPIGMRIDRWLADEYPELQSQQLASHLVQQQQNMNALTLSQGKLTVPVTLLSTIAAYALFSDQLAGVSRYAIPFEAAGVVEDGRHLLTLLDKLPKQSSDDRKLVEHWADACGMNGWFNWTIYQP
jgi:uncharacterized protein with beta-barrel porin domain